MQLRDTPPYLVLTICAAIAIFCYEASRRSHPSTTSTAIRAEAPETPLPQEPDPGPTLSGTHTLAEEVLQEMEICGTALSDARRRVVASQIARVATQYLRRTEYIQAYVGLLCIETRYNPSARSPSGAVGIGQIMPKFAQVFSSECGLGTVDPADLLDTETNLRLSACHFSYLLKYMEGNIALALSGYNSGQDSATTKSLDKLRQVNPETANYIAEFLVLQEKIRLVGEIKVGGK